MRTRIVGSLAAIAIAASAATAQNTVQWDRLIPPEDESLTQPPAVRVWLDQRVLGWGEPARVRFMVEEDAFVVVGRVDHQGNLTVLFPSNRNRVTLVKGGEENIIRGARTGTAATFIAREVPGSSGYVFALSSRTPMDLSRLTSRDFSAWVTGVSLGPSAQRYIGDPYRVIQRFARLVTYSPDAEFDYHLAFYSVDQPRFASVNSFGTGGFCNNFSARRLGGNAFLYSSTFDDAFLDYSGIGDCGALFANCFSPALALGWGMPFGYLPIGCGVFGQPQIANGPVAPVDPPPVRGTGPLNPWAADSIQRPNLDRSSQSQAERNHMRVDQVRPAPVAVGDGDVSFSIPSRALRSLRDRNRQAQETPTVDRTRDAIGATPDGRPTTAAVEMEWVRAPRALDRAASNGEWDRLPSRGNLPSRSRESDGPPVRFGSFEPPTRSNSPMFDRDPGIRRGYGGEVGNGTWSGGYTGASPYTPPSDMGGRPMTNPGIYNPGTSGGGGSPASSGIRTIESSPPAASPPPSAGSGSSSSGAEKKPGS